MKDDENNRIYYLIEFIKNKISYSPEEDIPYYDELLQCSMKNENLYGQALAYTKFAQVYQLTQKLTQYTECIKKAYEIAEREKFPDILISYYAFEGIRYMQNYDEPKALSMYLMGIQIATEISDNRLGAIFYNNIAEIFYENKDYNKAVCYYLNALNIMEQVKESDTRRYRKAMIENIINSYYFLHDLNNAKKYLQKYINIICDNSVRPFAHKELEIKVLMLEKKKEEALRASFSLLKQIRQIRQSNVDIDLLFYDYSFLCDIFLEFKKKKEAFFCLSKLEEMKMELSQNYVMETQKRKICYYTIFQIQNDTLLKEFYELTLQCEEKNTIAIGNSLSAAILLYETEKEKRIIKKERKDLEELVMYDNLTGVYNRRKFDQIVKDYLDDKHVEKIAYIMIDIDYFKQYNDYYGHQNGDVVLKTVSALIRENLPEHAYVARYGGDEFACLFANKSMHEVNCFMKKIQEKMKEKMIKHQKAKNGRYLTLSLGAYYLSEHKNINIGELIKKADDALYHVKNKGRNGYVIFYED